VYSWEINFQAVSSAYVVYNVERTISEIVVTKLSSSIRNNQLLLVGDRFLLPIKLMSTIPFPAIGINLKTCENTQKLEKKLEKGECKMVACQGILACRRKDSRGELVMSNCREPSEILLEGEDKN